MDNNAEQGVRKTIYESRCPSLKELFGYTSIVIVLIAIVLPMELNFGIMSLLQTINVTISNNETFPLLWMSKLGLVNFNEKLDDVIRPNTIDNSSPEERVFTKEEIQRFTGEAEKVYLAFLGKVYDVTSGRRHYGKDGAYSFFAGKDGSRGYVTGKFDSEGLIDNIEGLDPSHYLGLINWQELFEKQYIYLGKLEGYFYDLNGNARNGIKILEEGIKKGRIAEKEENNDKVKFPGCNSMTTQQTGSEVWCTVKSGGIKRDWVGVPRKFFIPGKTNHRCACIQDKYLSDPRFKEYKGCSFKSGKCKILED